MQISKDILSRIHSTEKPLIIGVSGFGGAGKSTLAKALGEATVAPVVGVDSFLKDGAFDMEYSLWEIMDFPRLVKEVLQPFASGAQVIPYGHFSVPNCGISEMREIHSDGILIVEGVGLFRPELLNYFGIKIWVDCPMDEAIARGKKRDREEYGNPTDEQWDGIWKKNDKEYLETYNPKEVTDFIFENC